MESITNKERVLKGKALEIVVMAIKEVLEHEPNVIENPRFQKFIKEIKIEDGRTLKEYLSL